MVPGGLPVNGVMAKYIEKLKVYNHYLDFNGHLFVKTLCDLFNDTAEGQTEMLGVDVASMNLAGQTWMLHRLHIRLENMPGKDDEVIIETWPSGIDRLFALRDYQLLSEEREVLASATSEWMAIDLARRRPVRLSEKIISMSIEHRIPKINLTPLLYEKELPTEMIEGRHFTATFDNIDFNGHVTQASYMRWIINTLSFDFLCRHTLAEVEVVYEHEIMPESEVVSEYAEELQADGLTVVSHRLKSLVDGRTHCVAKSVWKQA